MQMLFAAMLIRAFHAAFEDRVRTFDRVRADGDAGHAILIGLFLAALVNQLMSGELAAKFAVGFGSARHNVRFALNVRANDRQEFRLLRALQMERAS